MPDKEIGELWLFLFNDQPTHWVSPYTVVKLIRKLVEECVRGCSGPHQDSCLDRALARFGIPEETYK